VQAIVTSIAILLGLLLPLYFSAPSVAAECHSKALEKLRKLSPEGYRVYKLSGDAKDFLHWVTCDDVQLGLSTAVHETVHLLTEKLDAYPLIDGRRLPRVHQRRTFFPPRSVHNRFDPRSTYVSTYLGPGAATSADEFGYLLDELNAYTHDLSAAVQLDSIASRDREVYHRDGLAALMAFVASYVEAAQREHPDTWRELARPEVRTVVATLWEQAETVMGRSCRTRNYGHEAPRFLAPVCKADARHGLGRLLGRPPLCPVRCTRPEISTAEGPVFERTATLEMSGDGSRPVGSVQERIVEEEDPPPHRPATRTAARSTSITGIARAERSGLGAPQGIPPTVPTKPEGWAAREPAPRPAALETWPFIVQKSAGGDQPRRRAAAAPPVTSPPAAPEVAAGSKPTAPAAAVATSIVAQPAGKPEAAGRQRDTTAAVANRPSPMSPTTPVFAGMQALRAPLSAPVEAMMRWRGLLR
jgi:hypothetical protein